MDLLPTKINSSRCGFIPSFVISPGIEEDEKEIRKRKEEGLCTRVRWGKGVLINSGQGDSLETK